MPTPMKRRPPLEKEIQQGIMRLLGLAGFYVYSTSQGYRKERGGTRMSRGIPDLYAMHPATRLALWIEVKRSPHEKLRPSQVQFQARAQACGQMTVRWNSTAECRDWLLANAYADRVGIALRFHHSITPPKGRP